MVRSRGVGEGGGSRGNFGISVQASILKPTSIIHLAMKKNSPFIYLISKKVDIFIYYPLNEYTISYEKYVHINGVRKKGHTYTFFFKKGVYQISGGLEKGAIRHAHPYYVIYR